MRGARLVALGEATHGTEEFFRLKHRLVEHLVQHEGFRVLAIEDDFALVEELDRFAQGEDVSLDETMAALHPVWNCQTPRNLVRWIREHNANASPEHVVRIVGFDAYAAAPSIKWLTAYFHEVDPDYASIAESKMDLVRDVYVCGRR